MNCSTILIRSAHVISYIDIVIPVISVTWFDNSRSIQATLETWIMIFLCITNVKEPIYLWLKISSLRWRDQRHEFYHFVTELPFALSQLLLLCVQAIGVVWKCLCWVYTLGNLLVDGLCYNIWRSNISKKDWKVNVLLDINFSVILLTFFDMTKHQHRIFISRRQVMQSNKIILGKTNVVKKMGAFGDGKTSIYLCPVFYNSVMRRSIKMRC